MPRLISMIVVYSFLVGQGYALQVKPVKDDQSVSAKISSKELSRIFVKGDRIQATRGINGTYELIKDEKQGMVFVKPTPYFANRPFNLFITTENGHTYNLLLVPMDIPAENIQLRPLSPSIKLAEHWEKNSPYVEKLIQLMNSMVNQEEPDGYAIIPVKGKVIKYPDVTMQAIMVYRGSQLQGEIWCIKNCTRKTIHLKPNQFFQKYTRAIALEDETLGSGDETYLYKVNSHG